MASICARLTNWSMQGSTSSSSVTVASTHNAAIPALLAVGGLHHHLIRAGKRTQVGLVLESGEPREVHHFCTLIGYGCAAINPYLAFETLDDMIRRVCSSKWTTTRRCKNFIKAATKGVIKVASKIGISTMQSYRGAQIFEAVGLSQSVVDKYFTWTATRIEGSDIKVIAEEVIQRHHARLP
jgi:glutamate synthase (ferredoxin)